MNERKKINKYVRTFFFISFISITIVLILTSSKKTFFSIRLISFSYFFYALLTTSLRYLFDILRTQTIVNAMGKRINFSTAFTFIFGGQFLGGITPFQAGGIPLQLWILKRKNLDYAEGTATIFLRGLLSALIFPFLLPFVYQYGKNIKSDIFRGLLFYIIIFYGVVLLVVLLSIIFTGFFKKILPIKFVNGVQNFKNVFTSKLRKHPIPILISFIFTILSLGFYFFTAPLLLKGLGLKVSLIKVAILQVVLTYGLNFTPSPGASGFAEAGALGIFSVVCPKELLGIYVVLWRFLTGYLGIIVGGIVSSKITYPETSLHH
ncbi:flippase-like domain-containing protein [candidate division WOR-3 bacterium]|nr:flippase-like domain-containing protein [candidate division WOR-3 bacterium]